MKKYILTIFIILTTLKVLPAQQLNPGPMVDEHIVPPTYTIQVTQNPPDAKQNSRVTVTFTANITHGTYRPAYQSGTTPPPVQVLHGTVTSEKWSDTRFIPGAADANFQNQLLVRFTGQFNYTPPGGAPVTSPVNESHQIWVDLPGRRGRPGGPGGGGPGGGGPGGGGPGGGGDDDKPSPFPPVKPPPGNPPLPPQDPQPDPLPYDPDGDGIPTAIEIQIGTDPFNPDTDGDGMPDGWEYYNGLNPLDPSDAYQDPDGDGLVNLLEYQFNSSPQHIESEDKLSGINNSGDGANDWIEARYGTDPFRSDMTNRAPTRWRMTTSEWIQALEDTTDYDGDGLSDTAEDIIGTDKEKPDTDEDGVDDFTELMLGYNPILANDIKDRDEHGNMEADFFPLKC